MPNKYIKNFNDAFAKYQSRTPRLGFVPGFFSRFRHSNDLYPHIKILKDGLERAQSDAVAKRILVAYFNHSDTQLNLHSFSMYLYDELQEAYPDEIWKQVDVVGVEFYKKGIESERLYRGTRQPREDAFNNGIKDSSPSKKIHSYADTTNYSTGVSTSKNYDIAYQYAIKDWLFITPRGAVFRPFPGTYVYEIDYRGVTGVDIVKTVEKNGNSFFARSDAESKHEVNIVKGIAPQDIVGAWELKSDGKRQYFNNPNYIPNRQIESVSRRERFIRMFGDAQQPVPASSPDVIQLRR